MFIEMDDPTLPDAGGGMCCIGAAVFGHGRCTCWKDVFDREQTVPLIGMVAKQRAKMCDDCAFRKNSPERSGDPRFQNSDEGVIEALVEDIDATFYCHKGMRRRVHQTHPSGARVESGPANYSPPIIAGHPFKADGTPADICAGLCVARRKRA